MYSYEYLLFPEGGGVAEEQEIIAIPGIQIKFKSNLFI
jgi:hypothetical protein